MKSQVALLCATSALAFPAVVHAQVAASATAATMAAGEAPVTDEIVVTGSLTISNVANSPTPLTMVSSDELKATTPSNIPDGLNKLPVFLGSNSGRTSSTTTNNNAGNTLNLRNFGVGRTLVLLDGHRVAPSNFNGTVNTDVLPQMLVQRVDVVTGGASAVYGSDAVTGVVNFVLEKKLEGIKYNANVGISTYGDAKQYQIGVAGGTGLFGGRGHVEFAVDHYNQDRVPSSARPYNSDYQAWSRVGSGSASDPFKYVEYTRLPLQPTQGGVITCNCAANNMRFIGNGILGPFNAGQKTSTPNVNIGGDGGGYFTTSSFNASLRTTRAFGRFSYDVTDNATAYVNATWARSENLADWSAMTINPGTSRGNIFYTDNAFLSPQVRALLQQGNATDSFKFAEFFDTIQGASALSQNRLFQSYSDNRYTQINAGIDGKLLDRFNWSLYYTYGYNWQKGATPTNANVQKQIAAQDAVLAPNGTVVCRVSLTQYAYLYPGCVPLNPFGPDSITREAFDYATDNTYFIAKNTMHDIGGSITGDLFNLPAGPVKLGASAEMRWLKQKVDSDFTPTTLDCTGLNPAGRTPICIENTAALYDQAVVAKSNARMNVWEVAGELNIPVLKDLPFAQELNLNVAGRYTKYSTSGGAVTWKVGGDYHVNDTIRFRGTISRDIRAPNLYDLYAPLRVATGGYADLLTGGNLSIQTRTQGNPDLKPEVSRTYTAGVVLTPTFLPRFMLAIDWYKITMTDAITSIGGGSTDIQRLCYASGGSSPYCALSIRSAPITDILRLNLPFGSYPMEYFPTAVVTAGVNSATVKTNGVDVEASYRFNLTDIGTSLPGSVNVRVLGSYQPPIETMNYPGAPVNLTVMPDTRIAAFFGYKVGSWTFNLQNTWFSRYSRKTVKDSGTNQDQVFVEPYSGTFNTLDGTINKDINIGHVPMTMFLSVQNIFNRQPPLYTASNSSPGLSYPVLASENAMGRYFSFGIRGKF